MTVKPWIAGYAVLPQNPYVTRARVFLGEDNFVIAHIEFSPEFRELRKPVTNAEWYDYDLFGSFQNPLILHHPSLETDSGRISSWSDRQDAIDVVYHAKSPQQAEAILQTYLRGYGYRIGNFLVQFEKVDSPLPF
ncbi:MAG: hypothetical protein HYW22_01040 [Candidatus Aenigmarchaeota archaeon]|nr:hypothetical protein [Candidatus Aenigmarchaeota archaeon]